MQTPDASPLPAGRRVRRTFLGLILGAIVAAAGGCGTVPRPPGGVVAWAPPDVFAREDPRLEAVDIRSLTSQIEDRLARPGEPFNLLSLSGGGANGAYGAGVLVGWSQRGDRPEFSVVTGVSTGALAAPFAYLGPGWDDELQTAFAGGAAEGLLSWRGLSLLTSPSLFNGGRLRTLVDKNITSRMLREIAAEHARGRRLLVITTNLDTESTVMWDLGELASEGDERSLRLFRDVLVASASIPAVFPPVMIETRRPDGLIIQEMHVDGAVNTPFLAVPEGMMLWTGEKRAPPGSALYVLVNGKVEPETRLTTGSFRGILGRTLEAGAKADARTHLAANIAFAKRNQLAMHLAVIPGYEPASTLDFSAKAMARLFSLGRATGAHPDGWIELVPPHADNEESPAP